MIRLLPFRFENHFKMYSKSVYVPRQSSDEQSFEKRVHGSWQVATLGEEYKALPVLLAAS